MTIEIRKDLRPLFGPVRDQGSRPTCIAFAASDAHAAARMVLAPLSVEHLYYHAVQRTPTRHPDAGANMPTIVDALHQDGQALESGWPYLNQVPADLTKWKPPPSATPVYCRSATKAVLPPAADIYAHLEADRPVVLNLNITDAFHSPDANGVIVPPQEDPFVATHAVVAVALGERAGQPYLLVRNSWGSGWGVAGHAWLSPSYLDTSLLGIVTMQ